MAEEPPDASLSLAEARERLRARGYLDGGVERAVVRGALAARTRATAILRASAIAGFLLAAALAAAQTVLVAIASALPARDAAVLFLLLFGQAAVLAGAAVLVLVAVALWRARRAAEPEAVSTELGTLLGLLAGIAGALAAVPSLERAGAVAAAAILAAVAAAVFVAMRVGRGVALSVSLASGRALLVGGAARARKVALALALLTAAVALGLMLTRRPPAPDEPLVATASAHRVVVVGVDGWSDGLGSGKLAAKGGVTARYEKGGTLDPAAFWTTVATGEPPRRHGIGSLDLVRVSGLSVPVQPGSGSRWFLSTLLPRLGLARRESVTATARRVPAMWEVARRAGIPSLVVSWWTTYPADASGGTVLSNHLFFAARAGLTLAGEGWPPESAARAARLSPRWAPEPGSLERLVEDARGLDDFSVRAFRDLVEHEGPRLAMLYLPGLDILASALEDPARSTDDRVALAEALKQEASKLEDLLVSGALDAGADLSVVLLDGGRREAAGQVRLGGPLASSGRGAFDVLDVAPTVMAALGVPASRELPGRVRFEFLAPDAAVDRTVASWGRRKLAKAPPIDPKAYVDNLRSLGYLK